MPTAAPRSATDEQALSLYRGRHSSEAAYALNQLGLVQQLTGDYPAAAASHQQALALCRDGGDRAGQVEALNSLGELSLQMTATGQARDHHTRALAIARDIGAPLEEARALEGIGNSHLRDGRPGQAAEYLRQALAIYQRIGAAAARRVQETLDHRGPTFLPAEPQPADPGSKGNPPRQRKPSKDKS